MKIRVVVGLLYFVIATLSIYAIIKSDVLKISHFSDILSFRFLMSKITDESINKICSKSSLDLMGFYQTTPPDYDYEVPNGSETLNKLVKDLMRGTNSFEPSIIKDYFFSNGLTIFILVLFIFLVIFWIPFCSCICCKRCLCIPKKIFKCIKLIFICCLIISLIICIICVKGFTQNNPILSGIYGFGCSFLKITRHLIFGDDYTLKRPYWTGLTPILDKLGQTRDNISALFNNTIDLKNNLEEINILFKNLENDLIVEYESRNKTELKNPQPNKEKFLPINYLIEYGPPKNNITTLGGIYRDLKIFEPYTIDLISEISDIVSLSKEDTDQIVELLGIGISAINENINGVDEKIGNVLDNVDKVLDDINKASHSTMNIIFGTNLVLVILIIVSLVLIYFYKFGHCFLCLNWTLLYIIMLFSVVIGMLFLVIGLFLQNLSYSINNNIKDIKKLDENNKIFEVIHVCFNGDGLLSKTLIPSDLNISAIEKIYKVENSINEDINIINKYNFSSIQKAEEKYDDFKKYPKKYIDELVQSLDNIKKYIDFSSNESIISEKTLIYDEWEVNEEDCNEEYEYISPSLSPSNMRNLTSLKKCLVITEWKEEDIISRYKEIQSINETIILEEIKNYYKSINEFVKSKDDLIDAIKEENSKFNISLNDIKNKAIKMLTNILNLVKPFRESFRDIVGDGNIFDILNCSFLKRDFNKLMQVLYEEFGSTFRKTSDLFFIICVFQIFMTLFILVIIADFKYNQEFSKEKSNELYSALNEVGKLENI